MTVILDPECAFEELIAELASKISGISPVLGKCPDGAAAGGACAYGRTGECQIVNTITENSGIEDAVSVRSGFRAG